MAPGPLKILLADDSAHAQRMGKKILAAEGYEVATVSNGQAAAKMLPEFAPDLILADIFMPGRNGYELCQLVKSDPKTNHIPVVLVVGAMEPYDPEEGRKARADGLVKKPFESSDLLSSVQKLLAAVVRPSPEPPAPQESALAVEAEQQPAAWEEPEEEETWTHPKQQVEIPEAIGGEPVSAFGEMVETSGDTESPETAATDLVEIERGNFLAAPDLAEEDAPSVEDQTTTGISAELEQEFPILEEALPAEEPAEDLTTFISGSSAPEVPVEAPIPEPPAAEPEVAAAPETPAWAAETTEVTEEDRKLFSPPPSNWEGLTKLAEEEKSAPLPDALSSDSAQPAAVEIPAEPEEALAPQEEAVAVDEAAPDEDLPRLSMEIPEMADSVAEAAPPPVESLPEPVEAEKEENPMALDRATVERFVQLTLENMLPEIVDQVVGQITRATGVPIRSRED